MTHNIFFCKALKDEHARLKVPNPHCGSCRGQVTGNPKVDSTSNLMAAASSAGVRAMTCQERSCSRSTWKATAVVEPLQHTYGGSRSCGWKEVGRELLEGHVQTNFGSVIVCGMKEGTYVGTSMKASVTPHCVQSTRSWPLRHRLFPPVPVVYYEVVHRVDLLLEVLKRKVRPLGVAANEAVAEDDANHGLVAELLRVVR